ncbi:MAG: hypothetical protein ACN4GM_07805 [Gammaproteobacteria bacterium]
MNQNDLIKRREIRFCRLHPDPEQARSALLLLSDADGIIDTQYVDELSLLVSYDLRSLTLQAIEEVLATLGYHLDGSLITRMKRALYAYSEETQRANMESAVETDNTTTVFIKRYTNNYHGCRDTRPVHWRKYL